MISNIRTIAWGSSQSLYQYIAYLLVRAFRAIMAQWPAGGDCQPGVSRRANFDRLGVLVELLITTRVVAPHLECPA